MLHARLLTYIDEVARNGSIRAAAARLHVAPSAINRQILLYEGEIGEDLFERLPRGMRLTPAGEVLVAHIRGTMRQYREAVAEMRALQSQPRGEVMVAAMTGLASSVVSAAAVRLTSRFPSVHVTIRTMFAREIVDAIQQSAADLGLGFSIPAAAQVHVHWQTDTSLGAVVSAAHPLAALRSVSLGQCAEYPLILADRSMAIHDAVAGAFEAADIAIEPAFHTNSMEAMKKIASAGRAVAFLSPYDIVDERHDARLVYRPVADQVFGTNMLSLVRREAQGHNPAVMLFADEIVGLLESVAEAGPPRGVRAGPGAAVSGTRSPRPVTADGGGAISSAG